MQGLGLLMLVRVILDERLPAVRNAITDTTLQ